jgi:hypothetical protein
MMAHQSTEGLVSSGASNAPRRTVLAERLRAVHEARVKIVPGSEQRRRRHTVSPLWYDSPPDAAAD